MVTVDEMTLLRGCPIPVADGCHVRQPTLGQIADHGYSSYRSYLSVFMTDKEALLNALDVENAADFANVSIYEIIGLIPDLREALLNALSFFVCEPVSWREGAFFIGGRPTSKDLLNDIKSAVMAVSYVSHDSESEHVFSSERARKIWEKCHKGKEALKKANKTDENMNLPNLIGAISATGFGNYNILNIWDLTVCQLYDQFARTNIGVQMDIYSKRWAAWGKDDFDVSMWFKNTMKKEG